MPAVVTFLEEAPATLNEIEDQIVQRKFSKVAKGKMEWLGTLKNVAEQFLEQEQWDRVLDQVEQARGVILEITQEPYTKLEAVVNFVTEYTPKLEKIVQDVVERKFSKVAKVILNNLQKVKLFGFLIFYLEQNGVGQYSHWSCPTKCECRSVRSSSGQGRRSQKCCS